MTSACRGTLALAAAGLLLTGCASGGQVNSTWGQYGTVLKQSFAATFGGGDGISRDQAAAIPYASLGYRLDGGLQTLLVLATDSNGEQLWTSGAHVVIMTRDGRVTRTVGLPHDLGRLIPNRAASSLPAPAAALHGAFAVTLLADFPDQNLYSVMLDCRLTAAGPETLTILGQPIATTRVDEACSSSTQDWHFVNHYWVDGDNFAWRSVQAISPKGDVLDIEILRPPG